MEQELITVDEIHKDLNIAKLGDKMVLTDGNHKIIGDGAYDNIERCRGYSNYSNINPDTPYFLIVSRKSKFGLIDNRGKEIKSCIYDKIEMLSNKYGIDYRLRKKWISFVVDSYGRFTFTGSLFDLFFRAQEIMEKTFDAISNFILDNLGKFFWSGIVLFILGSIIENNVWSTILYAGAFILAISPIISMASMLFLIIFNTLFVISPFIIAFLLLPFSLPLTIIHISKIAYSRLYQENKRLFDGLYALYCAGLAILLYTVESFRVMVPLSWFIF